MIVKPVGIENVVNWQDNGIFADTQKPVTDDNYTLAGDVNQDNLYVGYMKEHGLKGKLSLPVLSSLGAITGRQTIGDCEVYKHVNGTTIIKGAVINPNLPDSRISLGFSADENGLQYYNNPNDPMPIKTRNMAGLQKWEETDDYIIYLDKDAVITTVQNYVPGTYDLFLEERRAIENDVNRFRTWTSKDDSELLLKINDEQLKRIAETPVNMDEPSEIQTFSSRAVPTTYECCFRVDKETGEIYIGEGYENLLVTKCISNSNYEINQNVKENTITYTSINSYTQNSSLNLIGSDMRIVDCFFSLDILKNTSNITVSPSGYSIFHPPIGKHERIITNTNGWNHAVRLFAWGADVFTEVQAGEQVVIKKAMVVNSLTPKPFVRSVMPSGKLSFVTNATSETHSFVVKGATFDNVRSGGNVWYSCNNTSNEYSVVSVLSSELNENCDLLLSSIFRQAVFPSRATTPSNSNPSKTNGVFSITNSSSLGSQYSFTQLLIYKANLTESELKAENEKEINVGAYYHQENSVPLTYEIDSMKSMRVYSPALTDAEIAEEVNKNIYIPENRDGVPNYIGEVK